MATRDLHEEALVGAANRIANVGGSLLHGFSQQVHHALLEVVERVERGVEERVRR